MKNNNKHLLHLGSDGGLHYSGLNRHAGLKFKSTSIFNNPVAPILIMLLCAASDAAMFINMFQKTSYNSTHMIVFQTIGLLLCFDVLPIYIGIVQSRKEQALMLQELYPNACKSAAHSRAATGMAFIICGLGVVLNTFIRIKLAGYDPAAAADINVFDPTAAEAAASAASAAPADPAVVALTLFGILLPIVTSLTSYYVAKVTARNPLEVLACRQEKALNEKAEEVLQLEAQCEEYACVLRGTEQEREKNKVRFQASRAETIARANGYQEYVCQYFMKKLDEMNQPDKAAAVSALSRKQIAELPDLIAHKLQVAVALEHSLAIPLEEAVPPEVTAPLEEAGSVVPKAFQAPAEPAPTPEPDDLPSASPLPDESAADTAI